VFLVQLFYKVLIPVVIGAWLSMWCCTGPVEDPQAKGAPPCLSVTAASPSPTAWSTGAAHGVRRPGLHRLPQRYDGAWLSLRIIDLLGGIDTVRVIHGSSPPL